MKLEFYKFWNNCIVLSVLKSHAIHVCLHLQALLLPNFDFAGLLKRHVWTRYIYKNILSRNNHCTDLMHVGMMFLNILISAIFSVRRLLRKVN